jgi:hypothetical protein
MLLALGIIAINNRRNQALHEALFTLFYAAFAVELWSRDRSLLWAIPWMILVPILAWGAVNTYIKNKKLHSGKL